MDLNLPSSRPNLEVPSARQVAAESAASVVGGAKVRDLDVPKVKDVHSGNDSSLPKTEPATFDRERVLRNIEASRQAREASNFDQYLVREKAALEKLDAANLDDLLRLSEDTITKEILETKPKHSPAPGKWFDKGGTIEVDSSKIPHEWIYTDREGNTVKYTDGFPDFKEAGYIEQEVNIGEFTTRNKDFTKADKISPKQPDSTWHHHEDGKTLQEVPTRIHTRFTHRGGFSISRKGK